MELTSNQLANLIRGMKDAYSRGENAMAFARETLNTEGFEIRNQRFATLVAYDLQAGTYVENARKHPERNRLWCRQLADLIEPELPQGGSLLELGVGEGTTLAGILTELGGGQAFGFDISWSRIKVANEWLQKQKQLAKLFVGDLRDIPMADSSIDVVYSSHSLEPNGGREKEIISECLRVARRAVVLIEPIFELASAEAQARMRHHGYVHGLRDTAESLGAEIIDYRLLEHMANPLNPSGVLTFRKSIEEGINLEKSGTSRGSEPIWQCPLSGAKLEKRLDGFFAAEVGIAYPIFGGVPLLRAEHAIVASRY